MGCDIHYTIEMLDDGEWRHMLDSDAIWLVSGGYDTCWRALQARDYGFFAALAGVRGDGPEPNGVPEDATPKTQDAIERWGDDGHSHGWLPLETFALRKLQGSDLSAAAVGQLAGKSAFAELLKRAKVPNDYFAQHLQLEAPTMRVIFWFDN